ncbi:hypothetical protein K402DRAFT_128507 [Aulographum hederae CBS 113979]|uniref:Uncharacterized protein n=1 Tax=Aulographum hederae CBS 113979 TaxID=1176131 RepID=A0A6G1HEJ5_9PEZI|nr:hypothetical protein K402DRAFT_128507 [Aulographum hederae CBS 113979]
MRFQSPDGLLHARSGIPCAGCACRCPPPSASLGLGGHPMPLPHAACMDASWTLPGLPLGAAAYPQCPQCPQQLLFSSSVFVLASLPITNVINREQRHGCKGYYSTRPTHLFCESRDGPHASLEAVLGASKRPRAASRCPSAVRTPTHCHWPCRRADPSREAFGQFLAISRNGPSPAGAVSSEKGATAAGLPDLTRLLRSFYHTPPLTTLQALRATSTSTSTSFRGCTDSRCTALRPGPTALMR